jgi:hypothetical protein
MPLALSSTAPFMKRAPIYHDFEGIAIDLEEGGAKKGGAIKAGLSRQGYR